MGRLKSLYVYTVSIIYLYSLYISLCFSL